MKIGNSRFSADSQNSEKTFAKKTFVSIKDDGGVFRILPPVGSMADNPNGYKKYFEIVWGFKTSEGRNVPLVNQRLFNRKTKMVEKESPLLPIINETKEKEAKIRELAKEGKISLEKRNEALAKLEGLRVEKRFFLNAVGLNGEIVILKLNYTLFHQLEEALAKYASENGEDPIGVEGVFFQFSRSKTPDGRWVFSVVPYTEKMTVNVEGQEMTVSKVKKHKLDEAFLAKMEKEAHDLNTLYLQPTMEQLEELAKAWPNYQSVLESLLSTKKESSSSSSEQVSSTEETVSSQPSFTEEVVSEDFLSQTQPTLEKKEEEVVVETQSVEELENVSKQNVSAESSEEEEFLKSIGAL